MNRAFSLGGIVASLILIAVGVGAIIIGTVGRSDVTQQIEQEKITGSPDMTRARTDRTAGGPPDEAGHGRVRIHPRNVARPAQE